MASPVARALPDSARTRGFPARASSWRTRPGRRELLAERVAELAGRRDVYTFSHRRMPFHRGAIDLLIAGPCGVTVVHGLFLRSVPRIVPASGGFAEPRTSRLIAGDQDHSAATKTVERQVAAVRQALATDGHPMAPVHGALCVPERVSVSLLISLRLHDVDIDGPETIAFMAARDGELGRGDVHRLARRLERAFPVA